MCTQTQVKGVKIGPKMRVKRMDMGYLGLFFGGERVCILGCSIIDN